MEQLYKSTLALLKDIQEIVVELAKYNPGITENSRKSLITIAGMVRTLIYNSVKLQTDLTQRHERNQRDEVASNSTYNKS